MCTALYVHTNQPTDDMDTHLCLNDYLDKCDSSHQ